MEPQPIGAIVREAAERMLVQEPGVVYRQVRAEILAACPQYAESWALETVAGLVAEGRIPELDVVKALDRFRRRLALGAAGELVPIRDPASYLSVCLRDVLRGHGLAWRKADNERKRA